MEGADNYGNLVFRRVDGSETDSVRKMYKRVCLDMRNNGLRIWDYNYPCEYVKTDIAEGRLMGLFDGDICVASLAVCERTADEYPASWGWNDKGIYCERVVVDVIHRRKGYARLLYREAGELARKKGYDSIRAVAVDVNEPAIGLFIKLGYTQKPGYYIQNIDKSHSFRELGFEMPL